MASLELQFNCLCLFVTDPDEEVVHVLMPATSGHAGHAHHEHVVRIIHKSFPGDQNQVGRGMEGWALTLGPDEASAERDLVPPPGAFQGGELPDLTEITKEGPDDPGKTVDRALVGLNPGNKVAARITLRSGRVARILSEARWRIGTRDYALAHHVTWRMSDVGEKLDWARLDVEPGADLPEEPLANLNELTPEADLGYKLEIFHVTRDALPPKGGILAPAVMREHFRAFYPLIGEGAPGPNLLPTIKGFQINQVNCGSGQAKLKPKGG